MCVWISLDSLVAVAVSVFHFSFTSVSLEISHCDMSKMWPLNDLRMKEKFSCVGMPPEPTRKLTSLVLEKISSQLLPGSWHLCKSSWHTCLKHALLIATRTSLLFRGLKSPTPKLISWGRGCGYTQGRDCYLHFEKWWNFTELWICLNVKLCYCRYVEYWLTMKWPEIKEIRVIFKLL